MPSPMRPSARSVTTAALGFSLYFCLIGACMARSSSAFISCSLCFARHAAELVDPWQRRAAPHLRAWRQLRPLAQRADAQVVHGRVFLRCGPKPGTACRAKRLSSAVAALGRLHVDLWLAGGQPKPFLRYLQVEGECRAGERLAVRAVAYARFCRVGVRLEADRAAVTAAMDFHAAPFRSAAERLWMRPKPATKRASRGTIFQNEKSASSKLIACSGKRASHASLGPPVIGIASPRIETRISVKGSARRSSVSAMESATRGSWLMSWVCHARRLTCT